MFKVELQDIHTLYRWLSSEKEYKLGEILVDDAGITDITTVLKSGQQDFSLEGSIGLDINQTYVPFNTLEVFTDSYNRYDIKNKSKTQIILERNKSEYIIEKLPLFDIMLFTKNRKGSFRYFENILKDYALILKDFIEAYCYHKGFESPNLVYFIGKNVVDCTPVKFDDTLFNFSKKIKDHLAEFEKKIEIANPQIYFHQIGGCQQGKKEMFRIYYDILYPDRARFFGRDPEKNKGYLLIGESGCGKTLLVKALATKLMNDLNSKVKFYAINYEDITSIYRGGEAKSTGLVFDLVERNEKNGLKTLLFLDELHLIGSRSSKVSGVKDEGLDTLIAHLDGMRKYTGLTVIGATYQSVDFLDPALVRSGRLSKWIKIEQPNTKERIEILKIYIKQKQKTAESVQHKTLFGTIDLQKLAEVTENYNGSHIAGIVEEVIDKKEDETLAKAGNCVKSKEILQVFSPITTEDFLETIKQFKKVEKSKKIGFAPE